MARVEVVFRETDRSGRPPLMLGEWEALSLTPVRDRQSRATWGGRPVLSRGRLTVIRETIVAGRVTYQWRTDGAHPSGGGNRYHSADTLNEAQERVQAWARRRYEAGAES